MKGPVLLASASLLISDAMANTNIREQHRPVSDSSRSTFWTQTNARPEGSLTVSASTTGLTRITTSLATQFTSAQDVVTIQSVVSPDVVTTQYQIFELGVLTRYQYITTSVQVMEYVQTKTISPVQEVVYSTDLAKSRHSTVNMSLSSEAYTHEWESKISRTSVVDISEAFVTTVTGSSKDISVVIGPVTSISGEHGPLGTYSAFEVHPLSESTDVFVPVESNPNGASHTTPRMTAYRLASATPRQSTTVNSQATSGPKVPTITSTRSIASSSPAVSLSKSSESSLSTRCYALGYSSASGTVLSTKCFTIGGSRHTLLASVGSGTSPISYPNTTTSTSGTTTNKTIAPPVNMAISAGNSSAISPSYTNSTSTVTSYTNSTVGNTTITLAPYANVTTTLTPLINSTITLAPYANVTTTLTPQINTTVTLAPYANYTTTLVSQVNATVTLDPTANFTTTLAPFANSTVTISSCTNSTTPEQLSRPSVNPDTSTSARCKDASSSHTSCGKPSSTHQSQQCSATSSASCNASHSASSSRYSTTITQITTIVSTLDGENVHGSATTRASHSD